jgi:hypothetical protein
LLFLAICSLWFSSGALLTADFLPHRYCLAGNGRLLWTTVLGDLFIFVSYVAISATLVCMIRRAGPSLPYQGFFWAFGFFILSCGVTHFVEIVTVWQPVYSLAAAAKILTAVSSVGTAIVLAVAAEDIISFVRTARQATPGGQERFRALFMATPLAEAASRRALPAKAFSLFRAARKPASVASWQLIRASPPPDRDAARRSAASLTFALSQ